MNPYFVNSIQNDFNQLSRRNTSTSLIRQFTRKLQTLTNYDQYKYILQSIRCKDIIKILTAFKKAANPRIPVPDIRGPISSTFKGVDIPKVFLLKYPYWVISIVLGNYQTLCRHIDREKQKHKALKKIPHEIIAQYVNPYDDQLHADWNTNPSYYGSAPLPQPPASTMNISSRYGIGGQWRRLVEELADLSYSQAKYSDKSRGSVRITSFTQPTLKFGQYIDQAFNYVYDTQPGYINWLLASGLNGSKWEPDKAQNLHDFLQYIRDRRGEGGGR